MVRVVGARRAVLAGAVSAVANRPLDRHADVFLDPLDGWQQVLTVAAGGGHIGHIQNQLALSVDGDGCFEPVEALRLAFATMAHLGIGNTDDPIREPYPHRSAARRVHR